MNELIPLISVAFLLDLLIGDPVYAYHPVRIIGRIIARSESALRRKGWDGRGGGIILVLLVQAIVLSGYLLLSSVLYDFQWWLGVFFDCFLCYSCLAMGDLFNHIKPVHRYLEAGDLDLARASVARVVGREVQSLDKQGLSRAAVETLAENFVDGFLSPLFWCVAGGIFSYFVGISPIRTSIGFMLIFKVASTLDSMVGYRNERYYLFGWAGARLDDVMNFVPARLSLFFLFAGAWMVGLEPVRGLKVAWRDRLKHDSPNAAHAESFVAGALGIRLGGPTRYPEGLKNKPWLGDETSGVTTVHIRRAITLLQRSAWLATAFLLMAFLPFF